MTTRYRPDVDAPEWRGGSYPYDILKEGTIALVVVVIITVALAVLFGSPDEAAITLKAWSSAAPIDFAQTAFSELEGTSATAQYGAPYNHNGPSQQLGPLQLEKWMGVRIPIHTANDFVLGPLGSLPGPPTLQSALRRYHGASDATRASWLAAYAKAEPTMRFHANTLAVATTTAGPVPLMIAELTAMARSGALDQALVTNNSFYTTNYTQTLLLLSDGGYLSTVAERQHLLGTQWGMMNETGSYPGQAWLWLYTLWYQVPPYNSSSNGDVLVFGTLIVLSGLLLFVPFIPGLRSVPRRIGLYKLIWREHYRDH
jgi:hypothetical protein